MNANEGLLRVAMVIRAVGFFGFISSIYIGFNSNLIALLFIGVIFCAVCFGLAWVIDGFAKK